MFYLTVSSCEALLRSPEVSEFKAHFRHCTCVSHSLSVGFIWAHLAEYPLIG